MGIAIVFWAGWPRPPISNIDRSSAPIQKSLHASPPSQAAMKNEPFRASTEKGRDESFQAERLPMSVNLNSSSRMELETLPGIGVKLADRIMVYRSTHGAFRQVEDLVNVSGIGEKRLRRLLPYVKVEAIVGNIGS